MLREYPDSSEMSSKVLFFRIHFRNQDFLFDNELALHFQVKEWLHLEQFQRCLFLNFPHLITLELPHFGQCFFWHFGYESQSSLTLLRIIRLP